MPTEVEVVESGARILVAFSRFLRARVEPQPSEGMFVWRCRISLLERDFLQLGKPLTYLNFEWMSFGSVGAYLLLRSHRTPPIHAIDPPTPSHPPVRLSR